MSSVTAIEFKGECTDSDIDMLENVAYSEKEPLPLSSVVELPNFHRYQYTINYCEDGSCSAIFERITDWP